MPSCYKRAFVLTFCAVSLFVLFFSFFFFKTTYYESAVVKVPNPREKFVFVDIGKGFDDNLSFAVNNGVAVIKNKDVFIGNIRQIAIGNSVGNARIVNFFPEQYKQYNKIYLPYQIVLSMLCVVILLFCFSKFKLIKTVVHGNCDELSLFLFAFCVYAACAYFLFPYISSDSFVPMAAMYGVEDDWFTVTYRVMCMLGYVGFGHPFIFIHIFSICAASLIVVCIYRAAKFYVKWYVALVMSLATIVAPFLFFEVIIAERPFANLLVISGFLTVICALARNPEEGKKAVIYFGLFFIILGTLMRQDNLLYLFSAAYLFFFIKDSLFKSLIKAFAVICMVAFISIGVEYALSNKTGAIAQQRAAYSITSIFGYLIKNDLLTDQEKGVFSKIIDTEMCKKEWAIGRWGTNVKPCLQIGSAANVIDLAAPIIKGKIFQYPFAFLNVRADYFRQCLSRIFSFKNARGTVAGDGYNHLISIDNLFVGYQMKAAFFCRLDTNYMQQFLKKYLWNETVNKYVAIFLISISIIIFLINRTVTWRCFLGLFSISCIGPIGKLASLTLMAPFVSVEYLIDCFLFVMFVVPVLFLCLPVIAMRAKAGCASV